MLPVPNHTLYRQALKGALSELGKPWNWRQVEGETNEGAYEAAELWRSAINDALYILDCETGAMTCADVANCINTNELVAQAIANQVANNPALAQAINDLIGGTWFPGTTSTPGQPLDPGKWSENLTETTDCDFNVFWAQMDQMVEYLVNLGQDALESIALYNAALEAGQKVPLSGLIGKLKNGTTAGKVIEFLQWAAATMKVAYEAGNTEANRRAIKCALFCAGKEDDCFMSLDTAFTVLNSRLGGALNPGTINTLPELAETMVTLFSNPALALDTWLAFLLTSARVAGFLGVEGIDETLNLMLAVAVNDANNDWVEYCEDCNTPETNCMSMADWTPYPGGYGTKAGGVIAADRFDPGDLKYYLKAYLNADWDESVESIWEARFRFSRPVTNVRLSLTSGATVAEYTGSPANEITFNNDSLPLYVEFPLDVNGAGAVGLVIGFIGDAGENTAVSVTEFCYETIEGA